MITISRGKTHSNNSREQIAQEGASALIESQRWTILRGSIAFLMMVQVALGAGLRLTASEYGFDLRQTGLRPATLALERVTDGVLRLGSLKTGSTEAPPLAVGDRLMFRLFDDVEMTLVLRERTESPLGGETFLAAADGADLITAVVMQDVGGITVNVTDGGRNRVYTIVSTADGVSVRELNPNAGEREPCRTVEAKLSDTPVRLSLTALSADQASTVIDVLVAFDRSAVSWAQQNGGGITNFATMAVQKMNAALANTGFESDFRFRLVGAMAVDADGGGDLDAVLSAAQGGEGDWAVVGAQRAAVGADTVTVLIDTGSAYGSTGLGYSLKNPSRIADFADSAYNVCAIRSVMQSHTMTHETGHNLGAGHSDRQESQPGPQLYAYSSGYYFSTGGKDYHTIMAYGDDGSGSEYEEIPFFSSPDYQYGGVSVGDETHDNVKTIRNTYATAANWRKQVVPMSYDVYFSPEAGSMFTDTITITLTPGKAGLPIRYTLDGSMPTTSSTLYTQPIVLTTTTTIRAVTITDDVAGPMFEATYSVCDIGLGVDAPQLGWRTSSDYPWTFQTTSTYDGEDAVQSAILPTGESVNTWLETDVTGPTRMSFAFRRGYMYSSTFSVLCGGVVMYTFTENGYPNDWQVVEIDIPAGKQVVKFNFNQRGYYNNVFNGIYLDQVRFDALSRPPTISPATTTDETTATTFTSATTITLTPPADRVGTLYYTLDGGDPTGIGGLVYAGPIEITQSTRVRAVFVEGGKDASVEVGGLYLERHPVKPGEWSTDVNGVKTAAAKDGRLICVMNGNYGGCGITQRFYDYVALTSEFLSWAEANGVYLVRADSTMDLDSQAAEEWFYDLKSNYGDSGGHYYTRMYFASPTKPNVAISKGGAGGDYVRIGSVDYAGTVKSAVEGFASVLDEMVPEAPISSSVGLVTAYPVSVMLTNPTGIGSIHYTLDGSTPRRSDASYTGPITITQHTMLKAAVWPDSGCSSLLLTRDFWSCEEMLGTDGITWSMGGDYNWEADSTADGMVKTPYVESATYTSWLQASVTGKGKLVFTLRARSYSSQNTITFAVGGKQTYSYGYSQSYGSSRIVTLTNEVTTTGSTTFRWTYSVGSANYNYEENGAWLSGVEWIPEKMVEPNGVIPYTPTGAVKPIAVSSNWLMSKGLAKVGDSASAVSAKLAANGSNGIARYESYLLNLEPDSNQSAEEQLKVKVVGIDENGLPIIGYDPQPNDATRVIYRQLGKPALDSKDDWVEVTDSNRTVMHYYRVRAEIIK